MLYTTMQPQNFLGSGEELFFKCFTIHIYGHGSHLVHGAEPFEQIVSCFYGQQTPCEIWVMQICRKKFKGQPTNVWSSFEQTW